MVSRPQNRRTAPIFVIRHGQALGPEHPDLAVTLTNYGALLRKLHRKREARALEARARELRLAHFSNPGLEPGALTVDWRDLTQKRN